MRPACSARAAWRWGRAQRNSTWSAQSNLGRGQATLSQPSQKLPSHRCAALFQDGNGANLTELLCVQRLPGQVAQEPLHAALGFQPEFLLVYLKQDGQC